MASLINALLLVALSPFLFALVILCIDMVWVFLIALYLRNNGIVDIAYGLAFILVAATTLYNFGAYPLGGIVTTLVSVWGLRLAIRIHERTRTHPEDFRYAAWRERWVWFKTRSFFQIYMLQGFIVWLISLPVIFANTNPAPVFSILSAVGLFVWLTGFFFEAVGDYQLDTFIKDPLNKGALMTKGLWSITRHPNYFGEATMWWGMWLIALPSILPFGTGIVVATCVFSPVLITVLLLKISGVPMLEAAMQKKDGWDAYASRVAMFVPWFPKRTD